LVKNRQERSLAQPLDEKMLKEIEKVPNSLPHLSKAKHIIRKENIFANQMLGAQL
jgi:hypothetical protein